MGEIRPKTCEGRELTKDQLGEIVRRRTSQNQPPLPRFQNALACAPMRNAARVVLNPPSVLSYECTSTKCGERAPSCAHAQIPQYN